MYKNILPLIFILTLNFGAGQNYIWPTNASGDISSNFGEFRDDHFHMGIDIKTGGKTGFPVYAIDDGYISRIVTNYRGYGQAVYLRTNDGNTATYAHLSRFNDQLKEIVLLQQKKQSAYGIDLQLTASDFPVKKGDILGFSGNTGHSFGPHLHFELRNASQQPINPLVEGIPFSDTRRPKLIELAIIPLYPGSRVNGNQLPQIFPLYMDRGGKYFFPDTLNVDGTVGLAIRAFDRREGANNQYQAHSITLTVDKEIIYTVSYDMLDFNQSSLMNSVHDNRFSRLNLGSFQNLYRSADLPAVSIMDSSRTGELNLAPGYHDFEISVLDHNGNEARFNGTLLQYPTSSFVVSSLKKDADHATINIQPAKGRVPLTDITLYSYTRFGYPDQLIKPTNIVQDSLGLSVTVPVARMNRHILQIIGKNRLGAFGFPLFATFVEPGEPLDSDISLRFSMSEGGLYIQADTRQYISGEVSIRVVKKTGIVPVALQQIQPTVYLSTLLNPAILNNADRLEIHINSATGADKVIRHKMKPVFVSGSSEKLVFSNDRYCSIKAFPNTLYKPSVLWIETVETPPVLPDNGTLISSVYQLQPFELAAKDTFQVAVRLDEKMAGLKNVDLYYYDNKEEEWSFLKTDKKRNETVLISALDHFDAIAAIQDIIPPKIEWSFPAHGSRYQYQDVKTLKVLLSDNLSGIDPTEESLKMWIDGHVLLPAYQPVKKELSFELDGTLDPGNHTLDLTVRDKAGNVNNTSINFSVN